MAAAMLAPLVATAKDHKIISKALQGLAKGRKPGVLKTLLGGAGGLAKAFGFAEQAQYVRKNSNKKKKNRGSGGGGRGPGQGLPGGITVQAGNAPIQFARTDEITNFFRFYPTKNGCVVHCAVQVTQDLRDWSAAAGAFLSAVQRYISPTDTSYPWLSTFAMLWKKYRVKNLRLHYQHFAATSTEGEVILKYSPDPDDPLASSTEQQICNGSNFLRGALYEDFMMECDLSGAVRYPLDTDTTDNVDKNDVALGVFSVFGNHYLGTTDNPVPAGNTALPGNVYVEWVIEFNDRFVPAADMALARSVMRDTKHTREEKLAALSVLMDREEAAVRAAKVAVKRVDPVDELLQRLPDVAVSRGLRPKSGTGH